MRIDHAEPFNYPLNLMNFRIFGDRKHLRNVLGNSVFAEPCRNVQRYTISHRLFNALPDPISMHTGSYSNHVQPFRKPETFDGIQLLQLPCMEDRERDTGEQRARA